MTVSLLREQRFRCESTNDLQAAFEKTPEHKRAALWNYFGLDPKTTMTPHRTVVTDCLSMIDLEEINHMETLAPHFTYHLACDGVWRHKYSHPHAMNKKGIKEVESKSGFTAPSKVFARENLMTLREKGNVIK